MGSSVSGAALEESVFVFFLVACDDDAAPLVALVVLRLYTGSCFLLVLTLAGGGLLGELCGELSQTSYILSTSSSFALSCSNMSLEVNSSGERTNGFVSSLLRVFL